MRTYLKNDHINRKNAVLIYSTSKIFYVGKVPELFFEKMTKKLNNFEVFLVEKVPKSSVFNLDCLENRKI